MNFKTKATDYWVDWCKIAITVLVINSAPEGIYKVAIN